MHIDLKPSVTHKILLGTFACCALLSGQQTTGTTPVDGSTPPAVAPGQPAGSYLLSGFETVNLFSGGLNLHLPLVSLKGRGGTGVSIVFATQRQWVMENVTL